MVDTGGHVSYQAGYPDDGGVPKAVPAPELYRVIWWQSMIQGMVDGETLEGNIPREQLDAKVLEWRISLNGAIGAMVGSAPMSFVPKGDLKDEQPAE